MYYSICPFQIVSEEIWYANPDGLQPQEVLSKVTREDFLRQNQKSLCSHTS